MHERSGQIGKLDFPARTEHTPLLGDGQRLRPSKPGAGLGHAGRFFEDVAEGIQDRDRKQFRREVVRFGSFIWAIFSCLCAGSLTAFSLYGHLFQSRLLYTQYQINVVSVVAELALYLPVPLYGFLCDRYGPRPTSLLSALFFGSGYLLAALTYRSGAPPSGYPFACMIVAFVGIGSGTTAMYLAAVSTCAKNFGRGAHRGFAVAAPIASFGLSGMWQAQVGARALCERNADGSCGDVDVYRYFLFLGGLLCAVGLVGALVLRFVDEDAMIDEAVDELERSGLLNEGDFYEATSGANSGGQALPEQQQQQQRQQQRPASVASLSLRKRQGEEGQRKKTWLLNEETRLFLSDRTMWWLAAGFFLVSGPGDAFINNLGTILPTLEPRPDPSAALSPPGSPAISAATHVSIVAVTSTVARVLSGLLSDALGPPPAPPAYRRGPASLTSSLSSLDPLAPPASAGNARFTLSRMPLLLGATGIFSLGFVLLASGAVQGHTAERFWLVSALVGAGYGAAFALVPIIIGAVWGVENFGTNWGVVAVVPAGGAALWSAVYAAVYEGGVGGDVEGKCYGVECYRGAMWAMAVSVWVACGLWAWAWRGRGGWVGRGVVV